MMITVPIDSRTADNLVVEHLNDWREYLVLETNALSQQKNLKAHHAADLKMNKKYIKALTLVIDAFTWPTK